MKTTPEKKKEPVAVPILNQTPEEEPEPIQPEPIPVPILWQNPDQKSEPKKEPIKDSIKLPDPIEPAKFESEQTEDKKSEKSQ